MPGRAAKILLAEDQALIALSLAQALSFAGHLVCGVATTTSDAMTLARLHRPDLALLDVHLAHGSDGREIAARLSAEMNIPSLLVTAQVRPDEARALGVLGLVPKPYFQDDVVRAVAEALGYVWYGRVPRTPSPHVFLPPLGASLTGPALHENVA